MKSLRKRLLSVAALSLLSVSLWTGMASPVHAAGAILKQGVTSSAVGTLQQNLKSLGYFQYWVTDYYGTLTKSSVQHFQWAYGLTGDGIVGPITQTAIHHALVKKRIVADSYRYQGIPYHWSGTSPSTGFDCSGFVYYMYETHGVTAVPRTSSASLYHMGDWVGRSSLQPGDLMFFSVAENGSVSHVGIYVGGGKFISALSSSGITVQTLNTYWSPRYLGAKRLY